MAYYHTKYNIGKRRKKSKFHRFVIYTLTLLIIAVLIIGYLLYKIIYHQNVWICENESVAICIPTNSTFENVKKILYEKGIIIHRNNFEWLAIKKKYPDNIKQGKYLIKNRMSNNELINLLRSGKQEPVNLIFNNIRTKEQLAKNISRQIESDSASIIKLLNDSTYISQFGLYPEIVTTIFIPNTYKIFWDVTAEQFIERMHLEYNKFWNHQRQKKADELEMTIPEVITLASIVEKETQKNDEKPIIAGVYINRLKRGWRLQADPTLIYALGDYNIRRVLNNHKEIDSPYNTYKYRGLPPGPICIPSISSIDAVLNYDKNNYLYFCARDDLSGYHAFARTNTQHSLNARKYREALNKLKIWK